MSVTYREENNIGFIELDLPDSKVNLLTAAVLHELDAILDQLKDKAGRKAVVIISCKKDVFIAGADIKEIEAITDTDDARQKSKAGQDILNKLEDLPMPTIAVLDGVALGGGCELALACQYRMATFNPKVKIGLPEVNLGILPGFGGTYRLPRLIGLVEGLKMILSGKPVDAVKALKLGLVDRLVPQAGLARSVSEFIEDVWAQRIAEDKYTRKKRKGLADFMDKSILVQALVVRQSRASVLKATKGFYPAPMKILDLIKKNFYTDNRQTGLDMESKAFADLAVTPVCKSLIKVFYLSEQYRKLKAPGTQKVKPLSIRKCGVLGAGVMGGGIAQLFSYRDIWVRLKDINYEALALGLRSAAKLFKQLKARRRLKAHEAAGKMAKITTTLDYSGFGSADIVIEAVVEKMEVKQKVFRELSDVVGPHTILASNTSALSVAVMAQETKQPEKVIGMHFFNPVHRMPLVEIITTPQTSAETLATTLELAKRLGKTPIVVKDACGFLVNRILLGYINEAGRLLEEGGSVLTLDKIMTDFGMPMGPFTLSDEVGLDVGIKVLQILEDGLGVRFKPVKIFEEIYAKGLLGKKAKKGFYLHAGAKRSLNPQIATLLPAKPLETFHREEALRRMVYIMINEAARCLEEKIVDDPGAVDVGMIFGTGFPPFRGGLLRYADQVGIAAVVEELNRLNAFTKDKRFEPAGYLLALREQKRNFYPD